LRISLKKSVLMLFVAVVLFAGGCASTGKSAAEALLASDYQTMTDAELSQHFRQLNDRLAHERRLERERPLLGRSNQPAVQALWQRRGEVREEMDRRGMEF
jgi:hypothetical protein